MRENRSIHREDGERVLANGVLQGSVFYTATIKRLRTHHVSCDLALVQSAQVSGTTRFGSPLWVWHSKLTLIDMSGREQGVKLKALHASGTAGRIAYIALRLEDNADPTLHVTVVSMAKWLALVVLAACSLRQHTKAVVSKEPAAALAQGPKGDYEKGPRSVGGHWLRSRGV